MINGIIAGCLQFQIIYFMILIKFLQILGIGKVEIKILCSGLPFNIRIYKATILDKFLTFCNLLGQLVE